MSDTWSLKNKSWFADSFHQPEMYTKFDIDILRKKLIEDIRLNAEGCTQVEEFEHIINRRFGVEE